VAAGWRVFFVDPSQRPARSDPLDFRFADRLPDLLRSHDRVPGQPFLLGPAGRPDQRVNAFFSCYPMTARDPDTWRKYAYALGMWLNFLAARAVSWDDTVPEDVEAFKYWRMADERNPRRVAPGTLTGNLIALSVFYSWAAARYGVANPVVTRQVRAPARTGKTTLAQIAASPVGVRRADLKWFTPDGYRRWRDVGLCGFGLDGLEDASWRGRNEQRDRAFADGLFETGLRLSEWASLLDVELPSDDPGRAFVTCWLADACAKGGYGRRFWLPRPALAGVLAYAEGGRAAAVRRAQQAGRYEQMADLLLLDKVHAGRRLRLRDGEDAAHSVSLDALTPEVRRRLFRRVDAGLEPLAVWLNEDGLPRQVHGWEHSFTCANQRLAALGLDSLVCVPHRLRHSCALRWYAVGKLLYDAPFAHLNDEELRDFRVQFGDTWQLVQTVLGHRSVTTTMEVYLEPFRYLDVELLLEQAAGVPIAELLAVAFRDHPRVVGDPLASASGQG
jgi:integrase